MAARRTRPLTIHEAVLQSDVRRVKRILRREPSVINNQDKTHGATPLMLAALGGSVKIVQYLLRKGASWSVRDLDGKVAAEYAEGGHAQKMRHVYRKAGTFQKSTRLKQVNRHLEGSQALLMQYRTKPVGTLAFERHGKSLRVFKLIAKVKFPAPVGKNTTSACICPGNSVLPDMCAVSGWTYINTPGLVNGGKYMPLVREMAGMFKVDLPASCYDNPSNESHPGPHNTGRVQAVRILTAVATELV